MVAGRLDFPETLPRAPAVSRATLDKAAAAARDLVSDVARPLNLSYAVFIHHPEKGSRAAGSAAASRFFTDPDIQSSFVTACMPIDGWHQANIGQEYEGDNGKHVRGVVSLQGLMNNVCVCLLSELKLACKEYVDRGLPTVDSLHRALNIVINAFRNAPCNLGAQGITAEVQAMQREANRIRGAVNGSASQVASGQQPEVTLPNRPSAASSRSQHDHAAPKVLVRCHVWNPLSSSA